MLRVQVWKLNIHAMLQHIPTMLPFYNSNGNGEVSEEDFKEGLSKLKIKSSSKEVKAAFAKFEGRKVGRIRYRDFARACEKKNSGSPARKKRGDFDSESESDDDIKIYIDSPGGSVYSGLGLLDVMDFVKPDIITINTGLAASMGAVILCSGTKGKRKALKRSRTMIHQPMSYGGYVQQASDMEIEAKEMNSIKKELYEIISDMTGQNYDRVSKDGDRDYWMTAIEAKKYGMIDEIVTKRK